jgi:signal transduction histidine kinase
MRWPIRNQIMYPLLGVALCSLGTVAAINAWLTANRISQQIEGQIRGVIGVLTTSSFPLTDSVLRQMRDLTGAEFVLHGPAGTTTATTLSDVGPLPDLPAVTRIDDVALGRSATVAGRSYFHTIVAFPVSAKSGRSGVLHVLFPQDEYRRAWRQAFVPSFVVGAVTVVAIAAVASFLARRMGQTTVRLREDLTRLARGDFRTVDLPRIDDEFRDLTLGINRTAEMLSHYEAQVRRSEQLRTASMLGASIAHQMRNAVTGCRMAVDFHLEECDAPSKHETLDVARRQLSLMESQLQRFLRIGKPRAPSTPRRMELGALVENTLALVRPAAKHAGVELDCRVSTGDLPVRGDEDAIQQVVLNLLLNAVDAAQQNGLKQHGPRRVCVELGRGSANSAQIVISDSGAGPGEAVAASLFEPFVTDKPQGAGLGLAVARDVIASHGGSIGWKRHNGMTQFFVELPLMMNGELACHEF